MGAHKFNPKMLDRLNDPKRLTRLDLDAVIERFHLSDGATLVDVGAGTGLFSVALLQQLPSSVCHALDIEPSFVDWMREHQPLAKTGRLEPGLMGEAQIPLGDGSVDFLFMISLHHELDDAEGLLRECRRVLAPRGGLFIADWDPARAVEGSGPPKDHMLAPSVAETQVKMAGFGDVSFLDASERYYCLSCFAPA